MRLALIADTHMPRGGRTLPGRCWELIASADAVFHAGDFTAASVLDELESLGAPVYAVHGNVDEPALRERLPATLEVEMGRWRIALIHDAGPRIGRRDRLRVRFPKADCVIFGHSHLPEHERVGRFQIFNPGSPTERRRAPFRAMGVLTLGAGGLRFRHVRL